MDEYESLSHSKWECKYHVVLITKCRRKTLYVQLRSHLGEVFRKLAEQKESRIEEGRLLVDHVHMLISITRKHAVSQVIGFIKGKSAIHLARVYGEKRRNFVGQHFWARGYLVSTVGRDQELIRQYIKRNTIIKPPRTRPPKQISPTGLNDCGFGGIVARRTQARPFRPPAPGRRRAAAWRP